MNGSIVVKVAQADGQQLASHEVRSADAARSGAVTVQAVAGQHIQLIDSRTGMAPGKVASTRRGDDLLLSFDADAGQSPQLVVKDFYAFQDKDADEGFRVYGDGEIGQVSAQGVAASLQSAVLAAMPEDQSGLILAQNDNSKAAAVPTAEAGGGLSSMQIAGLVGLGVVAAAAGGGGGGSDSSAPVVVVPPPVTPAPGTPAAGATPHAAAGKVLLNGTTSDNDPSFSGTGTAGDTVKLFVDGVQAGTATVGADGTFSVTPTTPLTDGSHAITYSFTNAGGTSALSPATTIVVDTTAPTASASIASAADNVGVAHTLASGGVTDDTTPTLNGTITGTLGAGEVVAIYNGATKVGEATVSGSNWSFTEATPLADGANPSYTAVVVDAVGNAGTASSAFTLTIATAGPTTTAAITSLTDNVGAVTGTLSTGSTTDDTTPTIAGTVSTALSGGEHVGIFIDGTYVSDAVVSGTNWTWTAGSAVAAGAHNVTAAVLSAADVAGAASTAFAVTVAASGTAGGSGVDSLTGDGTGNVLEGGAGADVLNGGAASLDMVSYAHAAAGVTLNLNNLGSNTGDAQGDSSFANIFEIEGSGFADTITGWDIANTTMHGGAGNDTLIGGSGPHDYHLDGGAGADALQGGGGFLNWAMYQGSAVPGITVDMLNTANNTGDAVGDTYTNITGLIGTSGADTLRGDNTYTWIYGGQGDDTMTGNGGDDMFVFRLNWGDGNKVVTDFRAAGMGNDTLLITNVANTGAPAWNAADLTAAGYDVTSSTSGADGVLRLHLTADGANAAGDTVITFTGAAGSFGGTIDSMISSGMITLQASGI